MARRALDVTLELVPRIPAECLECCFWELEQDLDPADARFQKEEWFSSTLLEWGPCGKLLVDGERTDAFAQYAPGGLFPRLRRFPAARSSPDAVYLANCYVVRGERRAGLGSQLVRTLARDLLDRGYRTVDAVGDRDWAGGAVLPAEFLGANGFAVVRDDPRFPLMRLDLETAVVPEETEARATVGFPTPTPAPGWA